MMENDIRFLPVPAPTAFLEEAALLTPILAQSPEIDFFTLHKSRPELPLDTIANGLLGLFGDYYTQEQLTAPDAMTSLVDAVFQKEMLDYNGNTGNLSQTEKSQVDQLVTSDLSHLLDGRPAGLLCFLSYALISKDLGIQGEQVADSEKENRITLASDPKYKKNTLSSNHKPVTEYSLSTDAISRNLSRLLPDSNEVFVGQASPKRGRRENISSVVTLEFPKNLVVEGEGYLSSYDKAILNGVSSLLLAGTSYFTIPMLYHAMTGIPNPSLDESTISRIKERLEFMRRTTISIDYTKEAAAQFMNTDTSLTRLVIENYLLPMSKLEATLNGYEVEAYHLIHSPPLYDYARQKKQLSMVSLSLLNAPLNNTATTIPLKNYILARIEGMKNPNNKLVSRKILFQSIFNELGESNPTKVRRSRIRSYTETFLRYLKDEGYIAAYQFTKNGRTIDGVEIGLAQQGISLAGPGRNLPIQQSRVNIKPSRKKHPVHVIEDTE